MLGFIDGGASLGLVGLTIDPLDGTPAFNTSDVVGLSAEFFREIDPDAPATATTFTAAQVAALTAEGATALLVPTHGAPAIKVR